MADGYCTCYKGEPRVNQTCGIANHREVARSELSGDLRLAHDISDARDRVVQQRDEAFAQTQRWAKVAREMQRERDEARAALDKWKQLYLQTAIERTEARAELARVEAARQAHTE